MNAVTRAELAQIDAPVVELHAQWQARSQARANETLIEVADREGVEIPRLCYKPGLDTVGNCRACMVEIKGERVLAPSCCRTATAGMEVTSDSPRAVAAQKMVLELLQSRHARDATTRATTSWTSGRSSWPSASRASPRAARSAADLSHPAIAVNLDACIQCTRCLRACRDEQVNDVIGLAFRGEHAKIVFDMDDPMGVSTCVACGECVQACPTGALMPARERRAARARQAGRLGLPVLRRRLPADLQRQGQQDPVRGRPRRPGQPRPPVRQGPLRLRLRPPSAAPDEAADPPRRCAQAAARDARPRARAWTCSAKRPGTRRWRWPAASCASIRDTAGPQRAGRLRLGQGQQRRGLPVPEAGAHRLRQQQRRPLHAPVPRLVGRRAAGRHRLGRGVEPGDGRDQGRGGHRHRRQSDGEPPGGGHLDEERGEERHQADRDGPAPLRPDAPGATATCSSSPTPTSRCSTR